MRHEKAVLVLSVARAMAASAEGLTLDELAELAGADRRTAERLRDAVRALFPALEELADGPRKRFRIPGGLDGFMQAPTADELAELRAAAGALKRKGGTSRADLLLSLATKVEGAVRPRARRRLAPDLEALAVAEGHAAGPGPRPLADAALLATLRTAIKAGSAVRFRYQGPQRPRAACVSPWGLLFGRAYYLVGPEAAKEEPVLWRLDRITEASLAGVAPRPPPADWSVAAYAARSFGVFQEEPADVVLRFATEVAEDAGRYLFHPAQAMERRPDGSLLVRFRAGGMLEMAWHLFTWGSAVTVLSPPALRQLLHDELRVAQAHHRRKM